MKSPSLTFVCAYCRSLTPSLRAVCLAGLVMSVLFALSAPARCASIDWTTAVWPAGSLQETLIADDGTEVTFKFTSFGTERAPDNGGVPGALRSPSQDNVTHPDPASPFIQGPASGYSASLQWWMHVLDPLTPVNVAANFVRLEVSFDKVVEDVTYGIGDIDWGRFEGPTNGGGPSDALPAADDWQDVVPITAFNSVLGTQVGVNVGIVNGDPTVAEDTDGNIYQSANNAVVAYGIDGTAPSSTTRGNVTVTFDGPIDSFVIDYYSGSVADGLAASTLRNDAQTPEQDYQFIRLHDVSFVPEPSGFALALLAGLFGLFFGWRRVRRPAR